MRIPKSSFNTHFPWFKHYVWRLKGTFIIPGLRCSGFCSKCRFCTWRNSTQCLYTLYFPFIGKHMCDLISLLRNSSTRPPRSCMSVVFRCSIRRQGRISYHTPKVTFVWIFLICYQFSEVPKMICLSLSWIPRGKCPLLWILMVLGLMEAASHLHTGAGLGSTPIGQRNKALLV